MLGAIEAILKTSKNIKTVTAKKFNDLPTVKKVLSRS